MSISKRMVAVLLTLSVMGLGLVAIADAGEESQFLSAINSSRASAALAPLAMSGSLQTYARSHSVDMANANKVYHSTGAQLSAAAGSDAIKLGENVGRGPSVSALHSAFMGSSGHKANILGDYNYVGIGTTTKDGYIYVTAVFMKKGEPVVTTTTTTSTTSTTSTTVPPPTTTTTTTTTPLIVQPPDQASIPGDSCTN